ncbi:acyltransferase family protein [Arthrobacter sp. Soil763]|uniref:acyltransferase family protein n=1 Tax=Arthrobacter sp. Soil763 TaxID=1736402 RepID=UPI0009EB3E48|nr:acyltransferase family protein [Arthrobacter sp. Soil763]
MSTVMSTGPAPHAPARDRYLDLLRAIALVRVVAYHTFAGAAWLSLVFPSMGVMFALAGSLMARSLERPALGVLRSRTRRLLIPLAVYSTTVLILLLWQGWTPDQEPGGSWLQTVFWFVPVADPPFPQEIGTDEGLVEASWAAQAEEILWYIRAYFWFMLLSPLLLTSFRRFPWATLVAPLALMTVLGTTAAALPGWASTGITDFATYGFCWVLGFAHYQGLLRQLPLRLVYAAGPVLMALGFLWAMSHLEDSAWDLNDIPLAQALWSAGFCAMLLRISPAWQALPRPLRFLDGTVTLMNSRAMTVYLWHNLLLVITVVIADRLDQIDALTASASWALDSEWFQFAAVWLLLALVFVTIGWVEDVAARRPPQLWPTGPGRPASAPKPGPARPEPAAEPAAGEELTVLPLTGRTGPVHAFKCSLPAGSGGLRPEPLAHAGEESVYVLSGRLSLVLGERKMILLPGESEGFDPRLPHAFGRAGTDAVEFLIFSSQPRELIGMPGAVGAPALCVTSHA